MAKPLRTSKENRHFHYYRIDEDGNGRTSMYVDKRTGSKHFHRITKFVVEPAGRDEHVHDLEGGKLMDAADMTRKDGSMRMKNMAQDNDELEAREIERNVRRRRRGDRRMRPRRRFSDLVNEVKGKGY